jgi:hypothetical protein
MKDKNKMKYKLEELIFRNGWWKGYQDGLLWGFLFGAVIASGIWAIFIYFYYWMPK